jgi:hypothetical protein
LGLTCCQEHLQRIRHNITGQVSSRPSGSCVGIRCG